MKQKSLYFKKSNDNQSRFLHLKTPSVTDLDNLKGQILNDDETITPRNSEQVKDQYCLDSPSKNESSNSYFQFEPAFQAGATPSINFY